MKRVRYLSGAVGLAPMVLGAVAGGGAHAAETTGHGIAVAPHAAAIGITGNGKTVSPHAGARWGGARHYVRENCLFEPIDHWVSVGQSGEDNVDCFGGHGAGGVKIYHIDYVSTGANKVYFSLYYDGSYYPCGRAKEYSTVWASSCGVPRNAGTMTYLSIY